MTAALTINGRASSAGLRSLAASWILAACLALVLLVQSLGQSTDLLPAPALPAPKADAAPVDPTPQVLGVETEASTGRAVLILAPFTSLTAAAKLGLSYEMQLLASFPAIGHYVFALPVVRVEPGADASTATVYFPAVATQADIDGYLNTNQLVLLRWVRDREDPYRIALVQLPVITPLIVDAANGIWRAKIPAHVGAVALSAWSAGSGVKIVSYDETTGELLMHGPKPPAPVTHLATVPAAVRTVTVPAVKVTTSQPPASPTAQTRLFVAFAPGATNTSAQQLAQAGGGAVVSYDTTTRIAIIAVPTNRVAAVSAVFSVAPGVRCVNAIASACASASPPIAIAPGPYIPTVLSLSSAAFHPDNATLPPAVTVSAPTDGGTTPPVVVAPQPVVVAPPPVVVAQQPVVVVPPPVEVVSPPADVVPPPVVAAAIPPVDGVDGAAANGHVELPWNAIVGAPASSHLNVDSAAVADSSYTVTASARDGVGHVVAAGQAVNVVNAAPAGATDLGAVSGPSEIGLALEHPEGDLVAEVPSDRRSAVDAGAASNPVTIDVSRGTAPVSQPSVAVPAGASAIPALDNAGLPNAIGTGTLKLDLGSPQRTAPLLSGAEVTVSASGTAAGVTQARLETLVGGTWEPLAVLPTTSSSAGWRAESSISLTALAEGAHSIRAVGLAADGSFVETTTARDLQLIKSAPAPTAVQAAAEGQLVKVSWTPPASTLPLRYNVYRVSASGRFSLVASGITETTFTDAHLLSGWTIGYTVTATDQLGNESSSSTPVWVTTARAWWSDGPALPFVAPQGDFAPTPDGLRLAAAASDMAGVQSVAFRFAPSGSPSWSDIPGALPLPFRGSMGGPTARGPNDQPTRGVNWNPPSLAPGAYTVRYWAAGAQGRPAQVLRPVMLGAEVARGPPAAGFDPSAATAAGPIHLGWTGGGTSFQVERSTGDVSGASRPLAVTRSTSFDNRNLVPGMRHAYRIVEFSTPSRFSSEAGATSLAEP